MGRRRLILLSALIGAVAIVAVFWPSGQVPGPRAGPRAASDRAAEPAERQTAPQDLLVEVTAEDGRPIEGASVRSEGDPHVDVFTDASGRAVIRDAADLGWLRARKPGYLVAAWQKQENGFVRFVLVPAPPVDGRVVFAGGAPAPGCAIRAWHAEHVFEEELDTATTDAEGRFQIAGVPLCQPFFVEASLVGLGPVTVRQLPIEVPAPLLITLGEGAVIEGVVTGPEGGPRAGARVAIVLDGAPSPLRWRQRRGAPVTTDGAGGSGSPA